MPPVFGDAYVFVKPTTGWKSSTETGKLVPSDASTVAALYGGSVAVSGNTIAVGKPGSTSSVGAPREWVRFTFF